MKTESTTPAPKVGSSALFALVEMPMPSSGPVKLIRENVEAHFGSTRITQHSGEFRMWSDADDGFKVTLDPLDALWIIDKLRLGVTASTIFRRSVTWANNQAEPGQRTAAVKGVKP